MARALALDLGGTKILAAWVDPAGRLLAQWRRPTPAVAGGEAVMQALVETTRDALAELSEAERATVVGVGVSAAGQIDPGAGRVTYASPNLPGWTGMPVAERLRAACGLPVAVENDANAAALGEAWVGAGRGWGSLVMVTVGTGVGGGVVLGGGLWRGSRHRGGEIGHSVVEASGLLCNCGQRGCLEVYASGTAIAREAGTADGHAAFAAAEAGDARARAAIAGAARKLATGLVSLSSVLDPEGFVLGGGVMNQPRFEAALREALSDPTVVGARGFELAWLRKAALGDAAGAVGAARLAFEAAR